MRRGAKIMEAERDDEAQEVFVEAVRLRRRVDVRLAKTLARIDDCAHFVFSGCTSVAEFGERHGLAAPEARKLASAGRAMAATPDLEARLLEGSITLDAAAAMGKLLEHRAPASELEQLLKIARFESARDLQRRVRRRLAELKAGGPIVPVRLDLTVPGKENLERAQVIASRRANRVLDESRTVEAAVDHYLDSFDAERKPARTRRTPPTAQTTGRYVPAEVKRRVRSRRGDRCAVPGCPNEIWLEFAHRHPHARGGDREAGNLHLLCRFHHDLLDLGRMTVEGTAENPVFRDADGHVIGPRGPPG